MDREDYGLMGKLYFQCFHSLYPTRGLFFEKFCFYSRNGTAKPDTWFSLTQPEQTAIMRRDHFTDNALDILNIQKEDVFLKAMDLLITDLDSEARKRWVERMISILITTSTFVRQRDAHSGQVDQSSIENYDENVKKRLIAFLNFESAYIIISYCIYLFTYFAAKKGLPDEFFFGSNHRKQLAEFSDKITLTYGCTSKPGVREIISMANRETDPNMYAQFAYAEMLYYGNNNGVCQNIQSAYEYYMRAAGELFFSGDEPYKAHLHPLALWSLACMYMDYHQKGTPLEDCIIDDIEQMSELERFSFAMRYSKIAFALTGSAGVANTLGRLAQMGDRELPGIERQKEKYELESADTYFDYAIGKGYVYAFNNRALAELKQIFTDPANEVAHLHGYLANLEESAKQYEPWAANRLGEFYRTGTVRDSKNDMLRDFGSDVNRPQLAKEYYKKAIAPFTNADSAWAYANLIIWYPEEFADDSHRLKQYAQRVQELNNQDALQFLKDHFELVYGTSLQAFLK